MNGSVRPALIRQNLYVPDLLAPAACFVILSALNRLRWSLFFIANLRRIVFVSCLNSFLVHANSRSGLRFLTRTLVRKVI